MVYKRSVREKVNFEKLIAFQPAVGPVFIHDVDRDEIKNDIYPEFPRSSPLEAVQKARAYGHRRVHTFVIPVDEGFFFTSFKI